MTIINSDEDKQEFIGLVSEALQEVMVPALEDMEKRLRSELASKKDLKNLEMKVDSLDKKFDASQDRLDRHDERIGKLEDIHSHYKHSVRV